MRKIVKYLLLFLIFINFLYCLSGVIHYPLGSLDEVSIWMIKAKLFYQNGVFPLNQLNSIGYGHPQYPILLPLVFYWIFKFFGAFWEMYALIFYPFLYLLVLFLCYKTLIILKIEKTWALLFTYLYSMLSPLLAMGGRLHAGEADIFIVLAYWLVMLFYLHFLKNKQNKWLIFIVLTIIIASNVKTEGLFLSAIFLFVPTNKFKKILYFSLSIAPGVLWILVIKKAGVYSDLGFQFPAFMEILRRIYFVVYFTIREIFKIQNWYIFWPMFGLSLVYYRKKFLNTFRVNILMLFLIYLMIGCNYVFSLLPPDYYVPSSIDRLLLQLSALYFPIFAYQTRQIVARIIK